MAGTLAVAHRADRPPAPVVILGKPGAHWWRLLTAPFTYNNTGYAFVTLGAIALFGWLLERRHGPPVIVPVPGRRRRRHRRRPPPSTRSRSRWAATAPRWRCCARGRSPTCSRCGAGEDIDGDLLGHGRRSPSCRADAARGAAGQLGRRRGRGRRRGSRSALPLARPIDRSARPEAWSRLPRPGRPSADPDEASPAQRTLIVPGLGPSTRRPITAPGTWWHRDGGHGGEQAAGGHRVADEPARASGTSSGERGEVSGVGAVAARARRRPRSRTGSPAARRTPSIAGHDGGVDLAPRRRSAAHSSCR